MEYISIKQFEQRDVIFTLEHREPSDDTLHPFDLTGLTVTLYQKIGHQEEVFDSVNDPTIVQISAPASGEVTLKPSNTFWQYTGMYELHFSVEKDGFTIFFPDTEKLYFMCKD